MASYLILFLLFLLQFIYFPIGISHFETPKVYLAQIGIFLLLLTAVLRPQAFSLKDIPRPYVIVFATTIILSLIHVLFMSAETTFFGNDFRLQGVLLLWMLIIWAILSSRIPFDKILHPFFLIGCLLVQLICTLLLDGEGVTRAIGTMGEPNALAASVLWIWPFLYFHKKPVRIWIKLGALGAVFLIIFLSGSRSGMIAFMLQLAFLLLSRTSLSMAKSVAVSMVLLLVACMLPFIPQGNLYEQRSDIWNAAVVAGSQNPILGNGFGNTEFALKSAVHILQNNLKDYYVDSSHNVFLDWWVQGGIVGLGIIVFLIGKSLHTFVVRKDVLRLTLFIGLLTALCFNPASIVSLIALWWIFGQGLFAT